MYLRRLERLQSFASTSSYTEKRERPYFILFVGYLNDDFEYCAGIVAQVRCLCKFLKTAAAGCTTEELINFDSLSLTVGMREIYSNSLFREALFRGSIST